MKSLFEKDTLEEVLNRIEKLEERTSPEWGKMDAAQMCTHCQKPLQIALKKEINFKKPGALKRALFSLFKSSLYNDKEWKKNLPTAKEFAITDSRNFKEEQLALVDLVKEFHDKKTQQVWDPHPYFGKFSPVQWGKIQYKHLDHHLRQFNV